jgi:hypothetical protein
VTPLADRLVRYADTPLEHEFLATPVAEREPIIQADTMGDDLGRVAMVAVGWHGYVHEQLLSDAHILLNPPLKLTIP